MRKKKSDEPPKIKLPLGAQARYLIEAQTAEFLKNGGKVDQIPNGVSVYNAAASQRPPVAPQKKIQTKK